jgi:endogenous inhibitor of DNA gyrase (YacG/DUF329 family)
MIVNCSICNKQIVRYNKETKKFYCSHKCYAVKKKEDFSSENNPNYSGGSLQLQCKICSKPFTSKRFGEKRTSKFCSHKCYSLFRSEHYVGSLHPNFKNTGGRITRPVRWRKKYKLWVMSILERDGNMCKICNSKECLEVHHIKPLSELVTEYKAINGKLNGNDDLFYDEKNGITLCKPCHKNVHKTKSGELLEHL